MKQVDQKKQRETRAEKRERKTKELQEAMRAAEQALKPPTDFGEWGVIRTRYWIYWHKKLRTAVNSIHPNARRLSELAQRVARAGVESVEACNKAIAKNSKGGAA